MSLMTVKLARCPRLAITAFVIVTAGLLASADRAFAQESEASIIGVVTDASGGVVPGVTVTAASPALQVGQVSAVSDSAGAYRLSPLPIGTYSLTFELSGFETVKQAEIRLTVGFVAKVNIVMKIGALQENVTVSGASPLVDAVSTSATTQLTREALESIPGSRNSLISVLAIAPGVRGTIEVGGSALNEQATFRAFGQSGEPWNLVEGVYTNAPQTPGAGGGGASGGAGNYFDFNAFDESAISTLGNGAKTPTRGIQVVSVVKSGGNQLHGSGSYGQHLTGWQADNLDDQLVNQGVTSGNPWKIRRDASGELGGKVGNPRLWFYTAERKQQDQKQIAGAFKPNGDPAVQDQQATYYSEKLSYQMSKSNRLVGFYQRTYKWEVINASTLVAWERRQVQRTVPQTGKIEWQALRGQALFDIQYGGWTYRVDRFDVTHGTEADATLPGVSARDQVTLKQWGENPNVNSFVQPNRRHLRGTSSWYKPEWFGGSHQLDAGFDYLDTTTTRGNNLRNQQPYELVFQSGAPFQIQTQNSPISPLQITHYLGAYVQDRWTANNRLTLNLGGRFARDNGFVPASCRVPGPFTAAQCWDDKQMNIWSTFTPRVHVAWDLTGNAHDVVKFGWGRFVHMRLNEPEVQDLDPQAGATTVWRWHDNNTNGNYDAGEVNFDLNGPDYVSGASGATVFPNPNDTPPYTDEFSGSFEHQFKRGFAGRFTSIYSRYGNTLRLTNISRPPSAYSIAVTRPDPGPDGAAGTADDPGSTLTYWEYPASLAGAAFENYTRVNDPRADASYGSMEVALVKRFSKGWQFNGSYSATHINGDLGANTALGPDDNPNTEIRAANHLREWGVKLSGSYQLPYGVMVSANYDIRSGDPWTRTVRLTGGRTIPNFTLRAEPIGTRYLEQWRLLDMRLQKQVRLSASRKLDLRANIFNVLNSNNVLARQAQSGASFGLPIASGNGATIMQPRVMELAASFSF
jgi:hypothetical protein